MATEEYPQGTLIGGRYEIRARLGQGGMGTVYRARDMKIGSNVALKLVTGGDPDRSKDRLQRFAREIMSINAVHHPNVLTIQEFGFHRDTPYMVMEFLDGEDLGARLRRNDGPLPVEYVVDVILAVCAAIRACHEAQVIHRDLKPGNIMLVKRDFGAGWDVKVVDFGISKPVDAPDLTEEGKIVGTPHFLAPEQITGEVSPASDQYAIGVLLYRCLTNRYPYDELRGLKLVRAIEKGEFPPPRQHRPEIPEELEQLILKAMRVDPKERHQSVFELGKQLRKFSSQLGRQFWERFYETPHGPRPKNDAFMSSMGIPLVKRIAEGQAVITANTVQAHYQSTTSVGPTTERTLKEQSGPTELQPPTEMSLQTPSGWNWETDPAKASSSSSGSSLENAATVPRAPVVGPWRRRGVTLGSVAVVAAVVAIIVVRSAPKRPATGWPGPAPDVAPALAPRLAEPSVIERPAAPVPVPPTAIVPATVQDAESPAPGDADAGKTARHRRKRATARGAKTADWTTDAAGNLIPPP
jgi:serine/threonine protein kinase